MIKLFCGHEHALQPEACIVCWKFSYVRDFNLLWGGDGQVAEPPGPPWWRRPDQVERVVMPHENVAPGVGDLVESALAGIGITKERVSRWLGRPCRCAERQAKLNRLGEWAKSVVGGAVHDAKERLDQMLG